MRKPKWEFVGHDPQWVAAPLRINRAGDTKPGFLCIHDLENGKGLCGSSSFENSDTMQHLCSVPVRQWPYISRPCYNKYHRCPGWAGGGWKGDKYKFCREKDGYSGYLDVNYEDRWWRWKTHRCSHCNVLVLPYMVRYTSPRSVWHTLRHARDRWMWLYRLETWFLVYVLRRFNGKR